VATSDPHQRRRRNLPDRSRDGDQASCRDCLVDDAFGCVGLRHAQWRAELGKNLLERVVLGWCPVHSGNSFGHMRLDLAHGISRHVARQERLQRGD
jgi:hypothetical protein